ncbi:MAG: asparaginase domain-containing protein [Gammaproteobacteria bacterium]|nr:asparaginase domain-containing protein [Gammaproteobacteria bacterium]
MFIRFVTTGGTIDKIYFDALSQFKVGDSPIDTILGEGLVSFDYDVVSMFRKDSLDLTDQDREELRHFIASDDAEHYVVTHGTDTMVESAQVLAAVTNKRVVLTGALSPARFKTTDAVFNIAMAVATVQLVDPGVYITMNGQVFSADNVRKNREENRFEVLYTQGSEPGSDPWV